MLVSKFMLREIVELQIVLQFLIKVTRNWFISLSKTTFTHILVLGKCYFRPCWKLDGSVFKNSQTWFFLWSQPTACWVCGALQSESGWWRRHSSQWESFPPRSTVLDVNSTHSGWRKNASAALWKRSQDEWQINLWKKQPWTKIMPKPKLSPSWLEPNKHHNKDKCHLL